MRRGKDYVMKGGRWLMTGGGDGLGLSDCGFNLYMFRCLLQLVFPLYLSSEEIAPIFSLPGIQTMGKYLLIFQTKRM